MSVIPEPAISCSVIDVHHSVQQETQWCHTCRVCGYKSRSLKSSNLCGAQRSAEPLIISRVPPFTSHGTMFPSACDSYQLWQYTTFLIGFFSRHQWCSTVLSMFEKSFLALLSSCTVWALLLRAAPLVPHELQILLETRIIQTMEEESLFRTNAQPVVRSCSQTTWAQE